MKETEEILEKIPSHIDEHKILKLLNAGLISRQNGRKFLVSIKHYTHANDKQISQWLGLSERTYGNYKRAKNTAFKPQLQEHIIMILALIKHGIEVFGKPEKFAAWLESKNFFFDKKAPVEFLTTASGLKYLDDRLTAMEYGDNV